MVPVVLCTTSENLKMIGQGIWEEIVKKTHISHMTDKLQIIVRQENYSLYIEEVGGDMGDIALFL